MGSRTVEWKLERDCANGIEQEERASAGIGIDLVALFR